MACTIQSYDGSPIEGAVSTTSGVFAAFDWERLVLPPIGDPIIRKSNASANRKLRAFPERDRDSLKEKLGHYSDVQSLNSEDTALWSVFGTAHEEGWLNDVLAEAFGTADRSKSWGLTFWRRVSHPRTGRVRSGPESDLVIQSLDWRYVIEAKWTSDISIHKHGETQIEMRAHQAGQNLPAGRFGVIVITPGPGRYDCADDDKSIFRRYFRPEGDGYAQLGRAKELNAKALTWERLVEIIGDRGRPNLQAYMDWRLRHIRERRRG